jgi:hypothetical protein
MKLGLVDSDAKEKWGDATSVDEMEYKLWMMDTLLNKIRKEQRNVKTKVIICLLRSIPSLSCTPNRAPCDAMRLRVAGL